MAEIEGAARAGSPQQRVHMLRQVTDLFLSAADQLTENQIAVFDDILIRLIDRMEPRTLAQLSATLAASGVSPRQVVRELAYHDEACVAVPVLATSNRLSDHDLIRIASARSVQHLLAIAGRRMLSEAVTDIVLKRGNSIVFHALANNTAARFSGSGYAILIESTDRDETLAHKLGLRADIPADRLCELLSKAPAVVLLRLIKAAPPETRGRISLAIQAIAEQAGFSTLASVR
jgi:uncharacterized protein (DUF2336 family)